MTDKFELFMWFLIVTFLSLMIGMVIGGAVS